MNFNPENKFIQEYRILKKQKKFSNLSDRTSQKLNDNFDFEMYTIWKDFDSFKNCVELNQRKVIKSYGKWGLSLNFNSEEFFRDANFSLSLIHENKEIAIICFFPIKNKTIRIIQLQGQKGFEPDKDLLKDWKQILIDELKIYVNNLGFKNLEILRAEKNYLFKFPRKVDENFNLKEHQERMIYIYNVLPIRKWNFKYKKDDWYSTFSF